MTDVARAYEIHEVARLTGLATERLRAWERRYDVVRPRRLPNGYRAYTAEQVAFLRAIARRVAAGERIGELVGLGLDEVLAGEHSAAEEPLARMLDAVGRLDRERLEALVAGEMARRGPLGFAREVVPALAREVGDRWALGRLGVVAEHLASEVVVQALKGALRPARRRSDPLVLAACLPGERHEWGVLAAMVGVQALGWRVHYLGPDLPLRDLLEAAWRVSPAAVAVSVSDPRLVAERLGELGELPALFPPGVRAVIGGGGVQGFERTLDGHGFAIGDAAFDAPVAARKTGKG
jgi:DNA-binding transcriptional MerR regulator